LTRREGFYTPPASKLFPGFVEEDTIWLLNMEDPRFHSFHDEARAHQENRQIWKAFEIGTAGIEDFPSLLEMYRNFSLSPPLRVSLPKILRPVISGKEPF